MIPVREVTLNINALPETVFQLVKTDTVTLRELDGVISLFPAKEPIKLSSSETDRNGVQKSRMEWLERLEKATELARDEDMFFIPRSKEMRSPHRLTD